MTMEEKIDSLMTMQVKIDLILEKTTKMDTLLEKADKIDSLLEKADKIDMIDMLIEKTNKIDTLVKKTDKIDLILEKVGTLENDVKELKERTTALEKDHESMHRTLLLIQDDTSNKIPALFEGYSFHQQHIEEDEKRLDVLENVVDEHSIRISALEQVN